MHMQCNDMQIGDRVRCGSSYQHTGTAIRKYGTLTPPTCVIETDDGVKLSYDMAVCHRIELGEHGAPVPVGYKLERITLTTMRHVAYNMCDIIVHGQSNVWSHATMDAVSECFRMAYKSGALRYGDVPSEIRYHDDPRIHDAPPYECIACGRTNRDNVHMYWTEHEQKMVYMCEKHARARGLKRTT